MNDSVTEIKPPRTECVKKVKKYNIKKRNYVTDEEEYVPKSEFLYVSYVISYLTVLFFVSIWSFNYCVPQKC
jgi:hypothetical protein